MMNQPAGDEQGVRRLRSISRKDAVEPDVRRRHLRVRRSHAQRENQIPLSLPEHEDLRAILIIERGDGGDRTGCDRRHDGRLDDHRIRREPPPHVRARGWRSFGSLKPARRRRHHLAREVVVVQQLRLPRAPRRSCSEAKCARAPRSPLTAAPTASSIPIASRLRRSHARQNTTRQMSAQMHR